MMETLTITSQLHFNSLLRLLLCLRNVQKLEGSFVGRVLFAYLFVIYGIY